MIEWKDVETAFTGIFDRRWYTNHGPLARRLETEYAASAGVRHAIAATNPTIGLVMLADALSLSGEVLLSPLAPGRCVLALQWAGLQPRFCDIDADSLGIDPTAAARAITNHTRALLATPGIGEATLSAVTVKHDLTTFRDSVDGTCGPALVDLPALGEDAGAACLLTNDDGLAARLRNIRSSYGAGPTVAVTRTANGRLSEAQAAMSLLALADKRPRRPPPTIMGRPTLASGRDLLIVARNPAERGDLKRSLRSAGVQASDFKLNPRAEGCCAAFDVASRAVLVRADAALELATPVLVR